MKQKKVKDVFFLMASFKKGGATSSVLAIGVYLVPNTQSQQKKK